MLRVHVGAAASAEPVSGLDEIVAEEARRMLAAALGSEVDAYCRGLPARSTNTDTAPWLEMGTRSLVHW
jgi:hypothetical protein